MNKTELKNKLIPLVELCNKEKIYVKNILIRDVEAFEGYYVDFIIPDLTKETWLPIKRKVFNLLWDNIDYSVRKNIFSFCINNTCEDMRRNMWQEDECPCQCFSS